MVREAYDLDIVVYFPPTDTRSLGAIFLAVNAALVSARYIVRARTVALRLPYQGGFHIDVVPGRAQNATFRYATLFKNQRPSSTLQTSLKVHIDAVRKTGIRDIVKLMKLWRLRQGLVWSTFALEIAVAQALQGRQKTDYAACLQTVFDFLVTDIGSMRFVDPANTNNIVEVQASASEPPYARPRRRHRAPRRGRGSLAMTYRSCEDPRGQPATSKLKVSGDRFSANISGAPQPHQDSRTALGPSAAREDRTREQRAMKSRP